MDGDPMVGLAAPSRPRTGCSVVPLGLAWVSPGCKLALGFGSRSDRDWPVSRVAAVLTVHVCWPDALLRACYRREPRLLPIWAGAHRGRRACPDPPLA